MASRISTGRPRFLDATLVVPSYKYKFGDGTCWDGERRFQNDAGMESPADILAEDTTPDGAGVYEVTWSSGTNIGQHTVSAQAFDKAGNASPKFNRDVVVVQDAVTPNSSTLTTLVAGIIK